MVMQFNGTRVDLEVAQRMLDDGETVLRIAQNQDVSPQRIYQLLQDGRLKRSTSAAPAG